MNKTTKTAQFTPGPWNARRNHAETTESERINITAGSVLIAETHHAWIDWEEQEANAALIAAAPAMYDRHKDNHGMVQEALRFLYEGEYEEVKCLLNHIALNSKQAVRQAEGR